MRLELEMSVVTPGRTPVLENNQAGGDILGTHVRNVQRLDPVRRLRQFQQFGQELERFLQRGLLRTALKGMPAQ